MANASSSLKRCRRGAAAVEFAIVLPFAVMLYLGSAIVSDAVMTSRQVDFVTRTTVDLLSQQGTSSQLLSTPTPTNAVTAATLSTLLTSAASLMTPKSTTPLSMTLSAIDVRNTTLGVCCKATVRWSYTQNGTLRPCSVSLTSTTAGLTGALTSLPSAILPTGTVLAQSQSYLIADVSYTYTPIVVSSLLKFAPTMARIEYMLPRSSGQVITGALPASGTQYGVVCY